jgi:hypothetical protein
MFIRSFGIGSASVARVAGGSEHSKGRLLSLAFLSVGALVEQTFMPGFVRLEAVFIGVSACCSTWS